MRSYILVRGGGGGVILVGWGGGGGGIEDVKLVNTNDSVQYRHRHDEDSCHGRVGQVRELFLPCQMLSHQLYYVNLV